MIIISEAYIGPIDSFKNSAFKNPMLHTHVAILKAEGEMYATLENNWDRTGNWRNPPNGTPFLTTIYR